MRTLVLLPGMDGSDLLFGPLLESKPPDVRTITVSYPPGACNSYEDLLPMALGALPTDGPFYVLGWSFSGPMALMVAAKRPPGLRGIVMASSFVRRPVALPSWMRHLAQPALFRLYPASFQARALFGGAEARGLRHLVARAHELAGPAALACRARAAMAVDARELLRSCHVPVLYLRATADRLIARHHADDAQAILPRLKIRDIPGPHMALVTNPARSWASLASFMEEVDARGAD
ncbi:MAG TPA: alpha/beta fold hydrolase [Polyangia bacterium]|nr:alpha/beta fold hydrolase [Polyangia bacterium]